MNLAPRLDLRQSQSLVMTPQLQQAIKLLALSNLEIEAFIAEEVEKNPLLSAEAPGGDASDVSDAPTTSDPDGPAVLGSLAGDPPLDLDYATESHQRHPGAHLARMPSVLRVRPADQGDRLVAILRLANLCQRLAENPDALGGIEEEPAVADQVVEFSCHGEAGGPEERQGVPRRCQWHD